MRRDDNDEPLLTFADAVAKGEAVSWDSLAAEMSSGDARVIQALREIELIARAHSSWAASDQTEDLWAGSPRWRHLVLGPEIGRGAFGVVYRATDSTLGHDVALKLTTPGPDISIALDEARRLTRVRHPNVVAVHGADVEGGRVGVWMELLNGLTLEQLLAAQGPSGAREAAIIGLDLCSALAAVHGAGLLHRDIKARNVVREQGGRIVLMDFGAGQDVTADRGAPVLCAGTPLYAAPEVFAGRPASVAADIYSLGVLLYHLVTAGYPVAGSTAEAVREAHARGTRRLLRDARPDLPEGFVRVVERALEPEPGRRYDSAGAMASALSQFLGPSSPTQAPRQTTPVRQARWRVAAVVAAIALAAVGASIERSWRVPAAPGAASAASSSEQAAALPSSYEIQAQFQRRDQVGDSPLASGTRVAPGELLSLVVRTSSPLYVYVVNQDERGRAFLLFPLPGQELSNPLPANAQHRIPGRPAQGGDPVYWQVDTVGGREHFFVFASPEPQELFEQTVAALPRPRSDAPIESATLAPNALDSLRGVGGLSRRSSGQPTLVFPGAKPLSDAVERVEGLFVRQITFENPPPR